MKLITKVQTVSDIITNSSSEVFIVRDSRPFKEVKKLIKSIAESNQDKDESSGMGGHLEIYDWNDSYNEWLSWIPENKRSQGTPEMWALRYKEPLEELKMNVYIDIDWSKKETINWIIENLWVINVDAPCEIDPETGRVIKLVSWEEWDSLPTNKRNDY